MKNGGNKGMMGASVTSFRRRRSAPASGHGRTGGDDRRAGVGGDRLGDVVEERFEDHQLALVVGKETRKQATVRGAYDDGVWPLVYVSGYDTAPFCSTIGAVVSSPVR